ncbi:MAG: CHAT domain-containing protein [Cyanobacteria bacterium P01_F01_bin.53]
MNRIFTACLRGRYLLLTGLTVLLIVVGLGMPGLANLDLSEQTRQTQTTEAQTQTVTFYLDAGQQLYQAGRYASAIIPWQQALKLAMQQQDAKQAAIAQHYLAIGYQVLGQWDQAQAAIERSLEQLATLDRDNTDIQFLYAQLLSTQGSGQLQTGQAETALAIWQQAQTIYSELAATQPGATQPLLRNQLNQAQALRSLGFYRQAQTQLESANQALAELPDSVTKAQGLQRLGQLLVRVGELEEAQSVLSDGMAIAQTLSEPVLIASIQLDLAKVAAQLGASDTALQLAQQAQSTGDRPTQIAAALEAFSLATDQTNDQTTEQTASAAQALLTQLLDLPPNRWGINVQVFFARTLIDDVGLRSLNTLGLSSQDISQLLTQAIAQAQSLSDTQAEAAATGQLGHLYEQAQQWPEAQQFTQAALSLSQSPQPTYPMAQWQWQQGRILKAQGKQSAALEPYRAAVNGLESLQQDLIALNPDLKFSFREQVEPAYREYIELLLNDVDARPAHEQQQRLQQARETLEALQLAELQNYFRQLCLTYDTRDIESVDPTAAVIYPILLDQHLEVVTSLPGQPLQHYSVPLSTTEQQSLLSNTLAALHPISPVEAVLPYGQQLYDWLIRPVAANLANQDIRTLVFVPDGLLRNIPMSILHDGNDYLVSSYSLALTPGLQLLNSQPLEEINFQMLAAGLSDARQGFSALPGVSQELSQIQQLFPTQILLNERFTRDRVLKQAEQDPATLVHLATHGQFGATIEDTFLLTWDDRVSVDDLDQLLRPKGDRPIELLVLSACRTAEGDRRAALGMAGVAVRSGARSTLASLWRVEDNSTAVLMSEFYRLLSEKHLSRAEALRQAQGLLLVDPVYSHPYYWAPFVLIGNWQ